MRERGPRCVFQARAGTGGWKGLEEFPDGSSVPSMSGSARAGVPAVAAADTARVMAALPGGHPAGLSVSSELQPLWVCFACF